MTTVLVTKDYILADRLVDYGGTVKELPKIHKYKNKFVVYTGERVLDSDLWKTMIMSAAEKYLIEEKRTKVEGIFKDLIEKERLFDQVIIFTAKETFWLGLVADKFEAHTLNKNTVWASGSGQGFARAAWASGIAEKNIVPLVGSIDTATSQSYDLFYRKHLR
ncbi:hypothetical protein BZ425_15150 [Salmonella enterica subsp. enterica serovar Enteritidis]|nr:hypothetical protein [Salmonella enterica subsp. enterica serovar Kentucky]EBV4534708.1 hypothetical protein [Salmonella enterica subsp. enterica serovar Kentucky]EDF0871501.1 hypothetical protein [Salmonella enterica subsp. enterica serovar Enteritidis]